MCRLSLFFRVQKSGTEENLTIESQKVIEGGGVRKGGPELSTTKVN